MMGTFLKVGVRALDGITQKDDQPHIRKVISQTLGGQWMKQVVRTGFADDGWTDGRSCHAMTTDFKREVRAVPAQTAAEFRVKVVNTLDVLPPRKQRLNRRMLQQIIVK